MINKIKTFIIAGIVGLGLMVPLATVSVSAACATNNIANQVGKGSQGAAQTGTTAGSDCGETTGVDDNSITKAAKRIVDVISIIVGVIAVIMIIYGGFRYITSGGDSGRVGNAKNTLIYAIVGLIIVALAQIIVRFVLTESSDLTTGT